jgi:hypothetical protein
LKYFWGKLAMPSVLFESYPCGSSTLLHIYDLKNHPMTKSLDKTGSV